MFLNKKVLCSKEKFAAQDLFVIYEAHILLKGC